MELVGVVKKKREHTKLDKGMNEPAMSSHCHDESSFKRPSRSCSRCEMSTVRGGVDILYMLQHIHVSLLYPYVYMSKCCQKGEKMRGRAHGRKENVATKRDHTSLSFYLGLSCSSLRFLSFPFSWSACRHSPVAREYRMARLNLLQTQAHPPTHTYTHPQAHIYTRGFSL